MRTKDDLVGQLRQSGISFDSFESGSRWMIVAPALAARIMGAGIGEENAFWVPPVLSTHGWSAGGNAGGQRTWIAPEAGPLGFFFSADGSRWSVPMELDPGGYHAVAGEQGEGSYRAELTAQAADGVRHPIVLTRRMRIQEEANEPSSASCLRIRFRHELANAGTGVIDRRIGLWSIIQLPCEEPGTIFFGLKSAPTGNAIPLRPYFTEVPAGVAGASGKIAWLQVKGGRRYKVGLPCVDAAGTVAFVRRVRASRGGEKPFILTSMRFSVDPGATYPDKPSHSRPEAGRNGDAAQAYCDHGTDSLAFCEIEAHSPAPRLGPGESYGAEIEIVVARLDSNELGGFMSERLEMEAVPRFILPD